MKIIATITLSLDNAAFQDGNAYAETRRLIGQLEHVLALIAQGALEGSISPDIKVLRDVNGNKVGSRIIEIEK